MSATRPLAAVAQDLTERGLLIEAGFVSLMLAAIPPDAPQVQLVEMRTAFFAGALHVFASLMSILDPGEEPTDADLARMSQINDELERFAAAFAKRHGLTQ